ncbi:hypothetical protein Agub_g14715 [Astrephomene gubernaculifera]|uniref:Very-long-chain (3R)-3-hydroxyacyl-CoA dehydratase n=1 Tax=Astrephomene gubernaculifera TaxID=47775 RepID=A0AAD3E4C6_9CHLO|nr:hypothetical protein Agub_g14715 [Astrephomene gubernaculifera]
MRATQAYLLLYNAFQACGWAVSLGCLAYGLLQRDSPEQLYDRAAPFTKFFQGLSLLETLHAAAGLVPSSPLLALMQWAGRSNVLFLILDPITELHASWWAAVLLGAWAAAEVVRYPHYVATTAAAAAGRGGACPGWLTWLRWGGWCVWVVKIDRTIGHHEWWDGWVVRLSRLGKRRAWQLACGMDGHGFGAQAAQRRSSNGAAGDSKGGWWAGAMAMAARRGCMCTWRRCL